MIKDVFLLNTKILSRRLTRQRGKAEGQTGEQKPEGLFHGWWYKVVKDDGRSVDAVDAQSYVGDAGQNFAAHDVAYR